MTRILVAVAALGLGLSAASACDYQRSAKAEKTDPTVVASVEKQAPMSTPVSSASDAAKGKTSADSEPAVAE